MFTRFEREIICSEEKRKSVAPQTVRNTMQKIRNKATKAIEDLLFLAEKQPLQMAQVIGFTRSGRRLGKTKWQTGEVFRSIESKRLIKRIERGERARWLAINLALNTGIIDEWKDQKRQEKGESDENTKIIDMGKLRAVYPKILVAMLQNQFVCPRCGKAGLIFHGEEDWLWMHYNQDDRNPKANFCNIGKSLPERFVQFPLLVEPQRNAFLIKLNELGPRDKIRFFT